MNFKKNDGFTLVELIVVIAILGLLAGIGIPMYSGYVEKADKAVEVQNITMFHNAYVVACVSNEADPAEYTPVLNWNNGVFTGLANVQRGGDANAIVTEFNGYFGFPGKSFTFKHHDQSEVADGIKNGIETADGTNSNRFESTFESLKNNETFQAAVSKLNGSTFGTIGAQGLMSKVDSVTQLAAGLAGMNGTFKDVLGNNAMSMAAALGLDPTSETFTVEYTAKMKELVNQIAPGTVSADGTIVDETAYNKATDQILANYAVLEAAKSTTKDSATLLGELQQGIKVEDIKNLMTNKDKDGSTQEGLSQAAMMYAMYTAYANGLPEGEEKDKALEAAKTTEGFLANMNSDGFTAYLNGTGDYAVEEGEKLQAATDLEGYLGALDIINQSATNNPAAVEDLLIKGYTDPTLVTALQGLLGK